MGSSPFRCTVLFLKELWQPFQRDCSPILQLRRMDFILRGNLCQRLLLFEEFLNDSRFESGCNCFLIMLEYILFQPLSVSKFLGPVYNGTS
jgi:hypothetical protein